MNPAQLLAHFDRIGEAPEAILRLRQFILELAVRGKLVEQDVKDEPASELLKRIIAVKLRRGRVERVKKAARTSFEDTLFSLPMGWTWTTLADLVAVLNGRAYSQNELLNAGTPVLRVGNLFTSKHWYYSNLELEEDKYCSDGDLIFAWSASFGPFIWEGPKVIYHYHIWKLDLHSNRDLDKHYLYRFLLQKTAEIKSSGHGISMIHMTKEKMEKLQVPLPPLAEQHRIVAKVNELMELCDRLETAQTERESRRDRLVASALHHLNNGADPDAFREHARFYFNHLPRLTTRRDHIKQLRQTILNLAVRGKLVPQDPTDEPASELLKRVATHKKNAGVAKTGRDWVSDIVKPVDEAFLAPRGWAWTRIGNAVERVTVGYVGPMKNQYVETGIPFLRSQNVRANRFREEGLINISRKFHQIINKSALAPGDVVVVRSGNVGTACVIPPSLPEANCSDLVVVKSPTAVQPNYLCFYLNSLASTHIEAGAVGVALTHFNTKSVATMPLPLPPLAEQHRIVAKVDELMALCDQLETQLTTTQSEGQKLMEAILHEALALSKERVVSC